MGVQTLKWKKTKNIGRNKSTGYEQQCFTKVTITGSIGRQGDVRPVSNWFINSWKKYWDIVSKNIP